MLGNDPDCRRKAHCCKTENSVAWHLRPDLCHTRCWKLLRAGAGVDLPKESQFYLQRRCSFSWLWWWSWCTSTVVSGARHRTSLSMCSKDLACSMRMRLLTKLWFFRRTAYYSWRCKPESQSASPRRESRQGMRYCSGIDRQSKLRISRRH